MAAAREVWEALSVAFEKQDVPALYDLYADDAVFLEPYNPPHETADLIQSYLSSWVQARENIDITTKRLLEAPDGLTIAVEWAISYTAGGRRWTDLPRCSWFELDGQRIRYHRDYL